MPTYTYRCPECKNTREIVHKISEDPVVHCGECEDTPVMYRVIGDIRGKVLFKGKGWDSVPDYNTH